VTRDELGFLPRSRTEEALPPKAGKNLPEPEKKAPVSIETTLDDETVRAAAPGAAAPSPKSRRRRAAPPLHEHADGGEDVAGEGGDDGGVGGPGGEFGHGGEGGPGGPGGGGGIGPSLALHWLPHLLTGKAAPRTSRVMRRFTLNVPHASGAASSSIDGVGRAELGHPIGQNP
jgi:hypothetical protein